MSQTCIESILILKKPYINPNISSYINPPISIKINYNIAILAEHRLNQFIIKIHYKTSYKFPIDPLKGSLLIP